MASVSEPEQAAQDQAAKDDAHLLSLGIKPELKRTLGFLSNFAIAFSFISVSTGSFGNFGDGIGLGGPAFFWTWPSSSSGRLSWPSCSPSSPATTRWPGPIYQWSKRLSNRTLGWFTGWFYFWAQVVTVTAVAVIVAFVVDGILGGPRRVPRLARSRPASRRCSRSSRSAPRLTTIINAFGVRLLSILNNIGVATEILGHARVRPDPAVLREPPVAGGPADDDRRRAAAERQPSWRRSRSASSWRSSSSTASTPRARSARRPSTPGGRRREASSRRSDLGPRRRRSSCSRSSSSVPDIPATMAEGLAGGFPIATPSRRT